MSWQNRIIMTDKPLPPRAVYYGSAGVGKSTLASKMPNPILLDWDKGVEQIKTMPRIPGPKSWNESLELIREIARDPGEFKTLVIDTVDPLEDLAEDYVCAQASKKSIGDFDYGAGYEALAGQWRVLLNELDQVRARGVMICLLAHAMVRSAQDPTLGEYDEFVSQLQKKTWAATLRWADLVGFANFDAARVADEKRAIISANRVLYTQRGSGFQAKNRFGMPTKLPLEWEAINAAIQKGQDTVADVIIRIDKLAKGTAFEEKAKTFVLDAKMDLVQLLKVEGALLEKLQQKTNGTEVRP